METPNLSIQDQRILTDRRLADFEQQFAGQFHESSTSLKHVVELSDADLEDVSAAQDFKPQNTLPQKGFGEGRVDFPEEPDAAYFTEEGDQISASEYIFRKSLGEGVYKKSAEKEVKAMQKAA